MKTLVIPDIHLDIEWAQGMLDRHRPERVILLGDYLDPSPKARGWGTLYADDGLSAQTISWLAGLIKIYAERTVVLIGNHDAPYFFPEAQIQIYDEPEPTFKTPSYARYVQHEIEALREEIALIRAKALWYYFDEESGFFFTHAGVSSAVFGDAEGLVTIEGIKRLVDEGMAKARAGAYHKAFGIGRTRGGSYPVGGITWLDFNTEFEPVPGLRQVVGHTVQLAGFGLKDGNYCLDGMQTTVAIIEGQEIEVVLDAGLYSDSQ